jgi:hypothetical protein
VTREPWLAFRFAANPPTFYANKRWGHGRTRQLLRRLGCIVGGHAFGSFSEGVRRCGRGCGGLTTRGAGRCSECGLWAGPMESGFFGNLVGWVIGAGFLLCPDCAANEAGSSAAGVDGAESPSGPQGHHEPVGERQGRQPASLASRKAHSHE